jgi:hypothetical protein
MKKDLSTLSDISFEKDAVMVDENAPESFNGNAPKPAANNEMNIQIHEDKHQNILRLLDSGEKITELFNCARVLGLNVKGDLKV